MFEIVMESFLVIMGLFLTYMLYLTCVEEFNKNKFKKEAIGKTYTEIVEILGPHTEREGDVVTWKSVHNESLIYSINLKVFLHRPAYVSGWLGVFKNDVCTVMNTL